MSYLFHTAPDRDAIEANKLKEPEGERIRKELEAFLRRNKISGIFLDTDEHTVRVEIAKLPDRIKPVLTQWGSVYVKDDRRPKMQRVVSYFSPDGRMSWITMECGHSKPLPAGVYDENTKRLCRECAK